MGRSKISSKVVRSSTTGKPLYVSLAFESWLIGTSSWPSNENGSYIKLYQNLAAGIREGTELAVRWEEATSVIQLVELAHQSAKEGKTLPVKPL